MTFAQLKAIEQKNKQRWLEVNSTLTDATGIYILTRLDEYDIKHAYVGQSVNVLTRLAQHLNNYQYIDLSIKKHGLYDFDKNPHGWQVLQIDCPSYDLNWTEQHFIKVYADRGYQLKNRTLGSQGVGKNAIETKSTKGYFEGVEHGKLIAKRYVKEIFEKYLNYEIKGTQGKIKERKLKEFEEWMEV